MELEKLNIIDKELIDRAKKILYANIRLAEKDGMGNSLFDNYRAIIPSPSTYLGVWNWDAAFHMIGMSHFDTEIAGEQAKIMFKFQKENGQFPDCILSSGKVIDGFTKPPVWGFAVMYSDRISPDDEFLKYSYPFLTRNIEWWETDRYDGILFSYKVNKFESGWDNSIRWDFPDKIDNLYAVDCNCFIYSYYEGMEYIASRLGYVNDVELYRNKKQDLAKKINTILYDTKKKAYCDYNWKRKRFTNKLSPASFMPLWCNIASEKQAEAMAELAGSKNYFYKGIPTISYNNKRYNSKKYWRGPCWLNTAYFTIKGLLNYNYNKLADELRDNILEWCYREGDYYEYYDSISGKGLGAKGFGWSSVFVIELVLIRNKLNIKE